MVSDGLVGQVLDPVEAVRGVDDQEAQEDDEGDGVGHKLHEGATQDLAQLNTHTLANMSLPSARGHAGVNTHTQGQMCSLTLTHTHTQLSHTVKMRVCIHP